LQYFDDFEQLISQLPWPSFAKLLSKTAIVPNRFLARLAEARPDAFAYLGLSQIAKNCASVVDFVGKRDSQNVFIGSVEVGEISLLSLLPVCLALAFSRVGKAVRARRHDARDTITKPVADILQPSLPALILDAVVKKSRYGEIFVTAVL
jgi:hypothetical protein